VKIAAIAIWWRHYPWQHMAVDFVFTFVVFWREAPRRRGLSASADAGELSSSGGP